MNRTRQLKLGLVGAGRIASAYAEVLPNVPDVELVGVVDVCPTAGRELAAQLNCGSYTTLEQLVDSTGCEAAIVCTPPDSHPEITHALLDRGLHVLCEKPLATDADSARSMIMAAAEADRVFAMASKFRHVDDVCHAQKLIAADDLGEIVLCENVFSSAVDMRKRWNSDRRISGGGVLIDNGTHSVDIMRFLFGPIDSVRAIEGPRRQNLGVDETVWLDLKTAGGIHARIELSWSFERRLPDFLRIHGSRGELRIGWQESIIRTDDRPTWHHFGNGFSKADAFESLVSSFARAVSGLEPLRVRPEDGLAAAHVVEVAYQALARSEWKKLPPGYDKISATAEPDPTRNNPPVASVPDLPEC